MPKAAPRSVPRRAPLNMKTTPELRERLESAAEKSGRALTHEVEHRIEKSFAFDEFLGGPDAAFLAETIAVAVKHVQAMTGKTWREDEYTARQVDGAILNILRRLVGPIAWPSGGANLRDFKEEFFGPGRLAADVLVPPGEGEEVRIGDQIYTIVKRGSPGSMDASDILDAKNKRGD